MNWSRGIKRLAYVFIAFVWLVAVGGGLQKGPAALGENIGYALIFTLAFMVLYRAAAWVLAGFRRD